MRTFLGVLCRGLVPLLIASMISGCVVERPISSGPETVAPPPPPAAPMDYDRGLQDGRRAGMTTPMEGYFLLGVVAGVAVVAIIVAILAAKDHGGGGGGGGDCVTGCYGPVVVPVMPTVVVMPSGYQEGYNAGYQETVRSRRSSAFWTGFVGGALIFLGATIVYFSINANRDSVSHTGSPATSGDPLRTTGVGVRF